MYTHIYNIYTACARYRCIVYPHMYLYIYISSSVSVYIYVYAYMYKYVYAHTYNIYATCVYPPYDIVVAVSPALLDWLNAKLSTRVLATLAGQSYIYIYIYIYIFIYLYIYIHTHTHTHTYITYIRPAPATVL